MEQAPSTSLFSLTIDPVTKAHLSETAKWARFLAIVGMIFLLLAVVVGVYVSTMFSSAISGFEDGTGGRSGMMGGFGVAVGFFYIIVAAIAFFPLLFLLRFANRMKAALGGNDQQELNASFQQLKVYFRYLGIITILILALYTIAFVFGILTATMFQ